LIPALIALVLLGRGDVGGGDGDLVGVFGRRLGNRAGELDQLDAIGGSQVARILLVGGIVPVFIYAEAGETSDIALVVGVVEGA